MISKNTFIYVFNSNNKLHNICDNMTIRENCEKENDNELHNTSYKKDVKKLLCHTIVDDI